MGTIRAVGLLAIPLCAGLLSGCGSDSGSGGGGCQNLTGTYNGTQTCSDGSSNSTPTTVTQTGCNATIDVGGQTVTGTVSGSRVTTPDVSCTITFSGGDGYTADCTQKDSMGSTVTCHETGTVTGRSVPVGAGGSSYGGASGMGGSGIGVGGTGLGGSGSGTGGGGSGTCGGVSWSPDSSCQGCMESSCCSQLSNCTSGTPCGQLVDCIATNCASGDSTCIQQMCSAELQAGQQPAGELADCNTNKCGGCQ